jgi:HEPN domain-containing protein
MELQNNVEYRLQLAQGYLQEAEENYAQQRWRACFSCSILVIENAGIAILMLFGVSPMTHQPGRHLSQLISEGTVTNEAIALIQQLLPELDKYDSDEKMLAKYGDESTYRLPWELFGEEESRVALEAARKCMRLSREMVGKV